MRIRGYTISYLLLILESLLVHLQDADLISAQVGEHEEIAGGIQDGLMRPGRVLRVRKPVFRGRINNGLDKLNRRGILNVEGIDAASGATDSLLITNLTQFVQRDTH